jgi:hypothetical protein
MSPRVKKFQKLLTENEFCVAFHEDLNVEENAKGASSRKRFREAEEPLYLMRYE